MIVKLQVPIVSNAAVKRALIYNQEHLFEHLMVITEDMLYWLDGRYKAFFEVDIIKGELKIRKEVDDPGW